MGRHKAAVFEFVKALHCRYIFQTERCLFALTYYAESGFLEGPDCIFYSETCIPGDTTHRKSVDRVIAWNCNVIRTPSVITMCLLWRMMRKPAFWRALTASRWLTPGIFGTARPLR